MCGFIREEHVTRLRGVGHKFVRHSGHLEHGGFVAVAASDVFKLHELLFAISVWLLVTGCVALWVDVEQGG